MESDEVRQHWATREGKYSPEYYADIGPNEVSRTLADILDHYVDQNAAILEIGCGSGRHLEHLRRQGFRNLAGIDINEEAFDVMAQYYPNLFDSGEFESGAVEQLLPTIEDDAFDVVYSVETLQHIPPEETDCFEELPRITRDLLITAENEGNGPNRGRTDYTFVQDEFPLFYRDWKNIFSDLGMAQLLREPTNRDTIRVFRTL